MGSSRIRTALAATALLGLSIAVPTWIAFRLSWLLAVDAEQERLTNVANDLIQSADNAFDDAEGALRYLNATVLAPCTVEHISMLRVVNSNTSHITGVGYIDPSGFLRCTAIGAVTDDVRYPADSRPIYGAMTVVPEIIPRTNGSEARMSLRLGSYDVLIDPEVLLGLRGGDELQVAIALDGAGVLAGTAGPDAGVVRSSIDAPRPGSDGQWIYGTACSAGWTSAVVEPTVVAERTYHRNLRVLLPLAALVALVLAALSWFVLRWSRSMATALAIAIWRKHLVVVYQPIVELGTGDCVGVEALARWPRRDGSVVGPDEFVPIAEKSSLITKLTDFVITRSVREMAPLLRGADSFHLSINLAACDGSSGRMIDVLDKVLAEWHIRREQIWLELTERELIDTDVARPVLAELREHGYRIAIDDFGTGFSNLRSLERLPVDALKLDKSFVDAIGRSTSRSPVLPHIIDMARSLGLRCIAEGVETRDQWDYLRAAGVEWAQGWLISKPVSASEIACLHRRFGDIV